MARDNRTLGRFQLPGIPPAPRGLPQIEVAFDIDANGILHVSAKDLGTGREQTIEIKSSSGLSDQEVERMTKEAKEHEEEDKAKREVVELRNQADQLVYTTQKTLKDYGQMISASEKSRIEDACKALEKAKDGDDKDEIKRKMQEVEESAHALAQAMYQKAAKERAGAGGSKEAREQKPPRDKTKKPGGEDVIDAEFEVKDE